MTNPRRSFGKRVFAAIVCTILVLSVLLFVHTPKVSTDPKEWTEEPYMDFQDSFDLVFVNNVELKGTSEGAWIELNTASGWQNKNPDNNPGRRDGFGFAFDSKNNVAVLFGGSIANSPYFLNDTWEYNFTANTWTLVIADNMLGSPPRRTSAQMDYDSANNVIVLWGGYGESGDLADTWEYDVDARTWTETTPIFSPPAMGGNALAYDSLNSRILVSGTNEIPPGGVLHLWAYNAATDTWTERFSTPYPRAGHDMAFNGEVMVLQGGGWGFLMQTKYDDTLVYNYSANTWARHNYQGGPTVARPGPRSGNAMARYYNGVYNVNGYDGLMYPEDCWNFTELGTFGWTHETTEPKPGGRDKHRMVWDSYHKALILYGGYSESGRLNDTWVYGKGDGGGPPGNLRVERSPPNDIIVKWDAVPGADEYRIYESQDRFALWPWPLLATVFPPTIQYPHSVYGDGVDHFYIVRAFKGEESGNSTMGVKAHLPFSQPAVPKLTDINWLSLPYNTIYQKASDIANELTEAKIRVVGKWNAAKQKAITYTYVKGKWRGPDFSISSGEGVFIAGLQTNFDWVVTGTDSSITLNFVHYPTLRWNFAWISIPYTGIYDRASSIVIDIEGSPFTPPTKITEVGRWDASTQTAERYYWDGIQWAGLDFTIAPGDGIYLEIIASFNCP